MSQAETYPLSTENGDQIKLEVVKPLTLTAIPFLTASATTQDTVTLAPEKLYVFYTTQDCIVDFITTATKTPSGNTALLLLSNERGYIMPPDNLIGMSVIGLSSDGTLYVQEIIRWAGLTIPAEFR